MSDPAHTPRPVSSTAAFGWLALVLTCAAGAAMAGLYAEAVSSPHALSRRDGHGAASLAAFLVLVAGWFTAATGGLAAYVGWRLRDTTLRRAWWVAVLVPVVAAFVAYGVGRKG